MSNDTTTGETSPVADSLVGDNASVPLPPARHNDQQEDDDPYNDLQTVIRTPSWPTNALADQDHPWLQSDRMRTNPLVVCEQYPTNTTSVAVAAPAPDTDTHFTTTAFAVDVEDGAAKTLQTTPIMNQRREEEEIVPSSPLEFHATTPKSLATNTTSLTDFDPAALQHLHPSLRPGPDRRNVYVAGLPTHTSRDDLIRAFTEFGTIFKAVVNPPSHNTSAQANSWYGFVYFHDFRAAHAAVLAFNPKNKRTICGSTVIKVRFAEYSPTDQLHEDFATYMRAIRETHPTIRGGASSEASPKTHATATAAATDDDDNDAVASPGAHLFAESGGSPTKRLSLYNLYVSGLASDTQSQHLLEAFRPFGEIYNHVVKTPKRRNDAVFGFVMYYSHEEATNAVAYFNGTPRPRLKGVIPRVAFADENVSDPINKQFEAARSDWEQRRQQQQQSTTPQQQQEAAEQLRAQLLLRQQLELHHHQQQQQQQLIQSLSGAGSSNTAASSGAGLDTSLSLLPMYSPLLTTSHRAQQQNFATASPGHQPPHLPLDGHTTNFFAPPMPEPIVGASSYHATTQAIAERGYPQPQQQQPPLQMYVPQWQQPNNSSIQQQQQPFLFTPQPQYPSSSLQQHQQPPMLDVNNTSWAGSSSGEINTGGVVAPLPPLTSYLPPHHNLYAQQQMSFQQQLQSLQALQHQQAQILFLQQQQQQQQMLLQYGLTPHSPLQATTSPHSSPNIYPQSQPHTATTPPQPQQEQQPSSSPSFMTLPQHQQPSSSVVAMSPNGAPMLHRQLSPSSSGSGAGSGVLPLPPFQPSSTQQQFQQEHLPPSAPSSAMMMHLMMMQQQRLQLQQQSMLNSMMPTQPPPFNVNNRESGSSIVDPNLPPNWFQIQQANQQMTPQGPWYNVAPPRGGGALSPPSPHQSYPWTTHANVTDPQQRPQ